MVDRSFKSCNNWNSFHNDIECIKSNLIKNAYPPFLIDKVIKRYLNHKFSSDQNQSKNTFDVHYFKLPYIGNLSHHIKNKLLKLCKEFCKENMNIKLVFSSFKIKNYFSYKNPIPDNLKSLLVYKFTCASSSSSYIGETCRHFKTWNDPETVSHWAYQWKMQFNPDLNKQANEVIFSRKASSNNIH